MKYTRLFQPTKSYEDFYIKPTEKYTINGLDIAHFIYNDESPTILFCHGSNGNIYNRNYMIKLCKLSDTNLILFDYSGYGKSHGDPGTRKLLFDADTISKFVSSKIPKKKLIIWGESLGGPIAAYIASKIKCSKLILFSTFSSLDDLAFGQNSPWFLKCISSILSFFIHPLPTKNWLKETNVPTLIMHSDEDRLIDIKHAEHMKTVDPERIKLVKIKGGHSTPIVTKKNLKEIFKFLEFKHHIDYQSCIDIFEELQKNN